MPFPVFADFSQSVLFPALHMPRLDDRRLGVGHFPGQGLLFVLRRGRGILLCLVLARGAVGGILFLLAQLLLAHVIHDAVGVLLAAKLALALLFDLLGTLERGALLTLGVLRVVDLAEVDGEGNSPAPCRTAPARSSRSTAPRAWNSRSTAT